MRGDANAMQVRAFGSAACDLDVRFDRTTAREAVTRLLTACLADAAGDTLRAEAVGRWSLARRLQALLAVRLTGDSDASEQAIARCSAPGCGVRFEIEVPLARCLRLSDDADETPLEWSSPEGQRVVLRLPCADDLQAWRGQSASGGAMAATLIETVDGLPPPPGFALPPDWLPALEAELAEHDPLNALTVDAACPECGHVNRIDIELEALLLNTLAQHQRRLLDEVLQLAQALHWSEAQILALPAWRRAFYLARLDEPAFA